jgi:hypothetical protein
LQNHNIGPCSNFFELQRMAAAAATRFKLQAGWPDVSFEKSPKL